MSTRVQHAVCLPIIAAMASAVCWYSVVSGSHFVDSPHNGFFLKNAIDVLEGRVLFRDSFNSYGLLSTLIHAVGLEIWGWRIPALLNVTLVFVVALGVGVYVLWTWVMPPWAAAFVAALYFLFNYRIHLPWPNYIATCFMILVALALHSANGRSHRTAWLVAAGASCGLVFLARQTFAAPLLVVASMYVAAVRPDAGGQALARRAGVDVAWFGAGFAASLVPFFVYLIATAALRDWWIQSVALIPLWYAPFAQVGDTLAARIAYLQHLLFDDLPLITAIALISSAALLVAMVLRRGRGMRPELALLATISAAMLAQVYPNEGLWRHALACSVGFGWPIYWLYRATAHTWLAPVALVAGFLLLGLPKMAAVRDEVRAAISVESHRDLYFQYMTEPETFRGMWLPKAQASFYAPINDAIQTARRRRPDVPVITTNGDVVPLTFVRHNTGFNPMFTVYPSIAWAEITRNPAAPSGDAREAALRRGRDSGRFERDTANVLGYPDFWKSYAAFVDRAQPVVIDAGKPIARHRPAADVVFAGAPGVVDSQYYFWWSQFSDQPRSVVWVPQ